MKNIVTYQFLACLFLGLSFSLQGQTPSGVSGSEPVIDVIHGFHQEGFVRENLDFPLSPAVELIDYELDVDADGNDGDGNQLEDVKGQGERLDLNGSSLNHSFDESVNNSALGYSDFWSPYPNPSKGNINIDFEDAEERTIEVYNMIGQLVHQESTFGNDVILMDLSHLHEGMYIVQVWKGEQRNTARIEIVR